MKPIAIASLVSLLVLGSGAAFAQKQPATALLGIDAAGNAPGAQDGPAGVPDTILTIDISGIECWDTLDDPDNTVLTECLGPDAAMTGIGWHVILTTNGASWLSECVTYFDAADLDGSGLFLTVGVGNNMPGSNVIYDSGGIIDLTDNGIPNIEMQDDGLLYIQFFESFDDVPGSVDGTYQDGSFYDIAVAGYDAVFCSDDPLAVPTLDAVGLVGLALLLASAGTFFVMKRRRRRQA